jgi:hypothetical protein
MVRLILAFLPLLIPVTFINTASSRDLGQWEKEDPEVREWYQYLMQPDNPAVSCCGEAEAYWCDDPRTERDDKNRVHNYCTITDDRPDGPRRRMHVDIGTDIEIPDHKVKKDQGNPTGHGVVFLNRGRFVYCYVMPGGV